MLHDPDAIAFVRLDDDPIKDDAADSTPDTLPVRSPAVTVVCRLPLSDDQPRHRTELSDAHSVASHPVPPCRCPALRSASPNIPPCNVTRAEPVAAPFPLALPLAMLPSKEWVAVMLPALPPTVSLALKLSLTPAATRDIVVVSDAHAVRSHADAPPDADAE